MSRLTRRGMHNGLAGFWVKENDGSESFIRWQDDGYDGIAKLAHYEDLEEAGRLITLPCAVGDTVYKLWYKRCHKGNDYPDSYFCCGCEDECTLERAIFEFNVPSVDWILAHLRGFGGLVWFLTKAEAEAKLEEMQPLPILHGNIAPNSKEEALERLGISPNNLAELKGGGSDE